MIRSKMARQGLFGLAMASALGFGAQQALATPASSSGKAAYCTATWAAKCNELCQGKGYDYGLCDSATGACVCRNDPL